VVGVRSTTSITYGVAGNGTCLASGNNAASGVNANATAFGAVRGLAVWDSDGLFVSSHSDNRVRLVNLTTGLVHTWVNLDGLSGFSGDGDAALPARL